MSEIQFKIQNRFSYWNCSHREFRFKQISNWEIQIKNVSLKTAINIFGTNFSFDVVVAKPNMNGNGKN